MALTQDPLEADPTCPPQFHRQQETDSRPHWIHRREETFSYVDPKLPGPPSNKATEQLRSERAGLSQP